MGIFNRLFDYLGKRRKTKATEKQLLRERLTEASRQRAGLAEKLHAIKEAKREAALTQTDEWQRRSTSTGIVNKNGPARRVPADNRITNRNGPAREVLTVDRAQWYTMNSSNVDRIRYGEDDHLLQVIFKGGKTRRNNGSLYQYWDVEPQIFKAFLQTHSPGQFVWYVLRAYGYRYKKLAGGQATSSPKADRFGGEPFAVSQEIEAIQRRAGRSEVDMPEARVASGDKLWSPTKVENIPIAQGVVPPPGVFRFNRR